MMGLLERSKRIRRCSPCPACGHTTWCLVEYGADGAPIAALCSRVESPRRWVEAGWFHELRAGATRGRYQVTVRVHQPGAAADLERRLQFAQERIQLGDVMAHCAADLGVTTRALQRLGAGVEGDTLLFPMRNERGDLIGLRTRRRNAAKRSAKGSRNELFIPSRLWSGGATHVCEDSTDTAAVLALDLEKVGPPSAGAGGEHRCSSVRLRRLPAAASQASEVRDDDSDLDFEPARAVRNTEAHRTQEGRTK